MRLPRLIAVLGPALLIGGDGADTAPCQPPPRGIGTAGGEVTSSDGRAILVVPRQALVSAVQLEIVAVHDGLDPAALPAASYEVRPTNVRFVVPAELSIRVDTLTRPSGVAVGDIGIGTVSGNGVAPIIASTFLAQSQRVTASIARGGAYAAVWKGAATPCAEPAARAFDFWIGAWQWAAPNAFPGTEDVIGDANGCVLRESFADRNGARGRSISFYNARTRQWHQTYVDNQGGRTKFVGGLIDGAMTLYASSTSRTRWVPAGADTIRVEYQSSSDGGTSWHTATAGTLTRR